MDTSLVYKNEQLVTKLNNMTEGIQIPYVVFIASKILIQGTDDIEVHVLAERTVENYLKNGFQQQLNL